MRGVLLVTVAVILIVLGLKSSDSGGETSAKGKDPKSSETYREELSGPTGDDSTPEAYGSGSTVQPDSDAPMDVPGGAVHGELPFELEESAGQGGEGSSQASQAPVNPPVEAVPAWDNTLSPPANEVAGGGKKFILGPLTSESGPLAEALLESWIRQSPASLQAELDGAEPGEAADEQQDLVVAFWQAMVMQDDEAREKWPIDRVANYATPAQLSMLACALDFQANPSVPVHAGRKDPLARSMRMVLLEAASDVYSGDGDHAESARALSELLMSEVLAPWAPHRDALVDWAGRLNLAQAEYRLNANADWPSLSYTVANGETLELIRKRLVRQNPGLLMCTGLIRHVNGITGYIHPNDVLKVPTAPTNMLVDLDARMAFYRHGSEVVMAWTVGIGREGHGTPVGTFTVGDKLREPVWTRRGKQPLPYGHPENLLGSRWLGWYKDGKKTDYGFHGTNDPDGVGDRVSSGCIRMRNEDVAVLFDLLPAGSRVVVQR